MTGRKKKSGSPATFADAVRDAFESACLDELEALKPGNVHVHAEGHGMTVRDFQTSAKVAARAIAQLDLTVGGRIAAAVDAALAAVKCNTNLGIVLLAAPLVHAALSIPPASAVTEKKFRNALEKILKGLSIDDAKSAFAAIAQARPAGLGKTKKYDVNAPAKTSLITAMREAAKRDRIAWQYANSFKDVFEIGVPVLRAATKRFAGHPKGGNWATTAVYLAFLSRFPDSHIVRKHGPKPAAEVQGEASEIATAFAHLDDPQRLEWVLMAFDSELKRRGINPGTSADLTVASLLAYRLLDIVAHRTAGRMGGVAP